MIKTPNLNKIKLVFLITVAAVLAITTGLSQFSLITIKEYYSFNIGFLISSLNFYFGLITIANAKDKEFNKFMAILFGSMFIRMCVILLLIFILLKFFDINRVVFIFVVFITYFIYLAIEIVYLNLTKGSTVDKNL